jgi:hypothetical protein
MIGSLFLLQFTQTDSTFTAIKQEKGIIYLKDNHIIKNIRIREIKPFWVVYEKEGNLHDRAMDEIDRIEFLQLKSGPVKMIFEKNKTFIINLNE